MVGELTIRSMEFPRVGQIFLAEDWQLNTNMHICSSSTTTTLVPCVLD